MSPAPIDTGKKYFIRNQFLKQYLALNTYDLVVPRGKANDGRHEVSKQTALISIH